MQLPHVFFKFVMNQFLLFIHFPDLGNLLRGEYVSMLFLSRPENNLNLLSSVN